MTAIFFLPIRNNMKNVVHTLNLVKYELKDLKLKLF